MLHTPKFFSHQLHDGCCVVRVEGEIDLAVAELMTAELGSAFQTGPAQLLVDLTGVTFMDSSALSALVVAHRDAAAAGAEIRLVGPSARIRKLLAITQLDQLLPVYETVEDAHAESGAPVAHGAAGQ